MVSRPAKRAKSTPSLAPAEGAPPRERRLLFALNNPCDFMETQ